MWLETLSAVKTGIVEFIRPVLRWIIAHEVFGSLNEIVVEFYDYHPFRSSEIVGVHLVTELFAAVILAGLYT